MNKQRELFDSSVYKHCLYDMSIVSWYKFWAWLKLMTQPPIMASHLSSLKRVTENKRNKSTMISDHRHKQTILDVRVWIHTYKYLNWLRLCCNFYFQDAWLYRYIHNFCIYYVFSGHWWVANPIRLNTILIMCWISQAVLKNLWKSFLNTQPSSVHLSQNSKEKFHNFIWSITVLPETTTSQHHWWVAKPIVLNTIMVMCRIYRRQSLKPVDLISEHPISCSLYVVDVQNNVRYAPQTIILMIERNVLEYFLACVNMMTVSGMQRKKTC